MLVYFIIILFNQKQRFVFVFDSRLINNIRKIMFIFTYLKLF